MSEQPEPPKRGRGRPAKEGGANPKRDVRIGAVWDRCETIAKADGETIAKLITRLLEEYETKRFRAAKRQAAAEKQPDTAE